MITYFLDILITKRTTFTNNKYKDRYNNNNDCYVCVRLGEVAKYNPGFGYYDYILSTLSVNNIYLSTDSRDHLIIKQITDKYPNIQITDINDTSIELPMEKSNISELNKDLVQAGIGIFSIEAKRKLEDYFIKMVNAWFSSKAFTMR